MIKKIELQDFQSHHLTALELHPGVNVIVGPSDSGKSAVLRALRWAVENRGSAENFKSHWGDCVSVALTDEKNTVERRRDKKENEYILNGESFRAFGTTVPEPIVDALRFQDVNLQAQMDAPFLLANTPGEVARYLNGIMGLDQIDMSLAAIGVTNRELSRRAKHETEERQKLGEQVENLGWLDGVVTRVQKARETQEKLEHGETQFQALRTAVANLESVVIPFFTCLDENFEKIRGLEEKQRAAENELQGLRDKVMGMRAIVIPIVPELQNYFSEIEEDHRIITTGEAQHDKLSRAVDSHRQSTRAYNSLLLAIADVEKQIREAGPEICPTCGQVIK